MATYTIELNRLKFKAYHGVYKKEHEIGSFFYVDAALSFDKESVNELEDTINYERVFQIIKREVLASKWLMEEVLQCIVLKCKEEFTQLNTIRLRMEKESAPIPGYSGKGVAVIVEQEWN